MIDEYLFDQIYHAWLEGRNISKEIEQFRPAHLDLDTYDSPDLHRGLNHLISLLNQRVASEEKPSFTKAIIRTLADGANQSSFDGLYLGPIRKHWLELYNASTWANAQNEHMFIDENKKSYNNFTGENLKTILNYTLVVVTERLLAAIQRIVKKDLAKDTLMRRILNKEYEEIIADMRQKGLMELVFYH